MVRAGESVLWKEKTVTLIQALQQWTFNGEDGRAGLHKLGNELRDIKTEIASLWNRLQFPTFSDEVFSSTSESRSAMNTRRQELVVLATRLAPSNVEILDWLGDKEDKEAAYLYAYARGSVLEEEPDVRTIFYERLATIIDDDPALMEVKKIELLLENAGDLFAACQAKAYQNLD